MLGEIDSLPWWIFHKIRTQEAASFYDARIRELKHHTTHWHLAYNIQKTLIKKYSVPKIYNVERNVTSTLYILL